MTHDPLCQYRPEQTCAHCKCVTSYSIRCTCAFIWMVRADEREQAAERIITALTDRYVHNWDKRPARGMAIQVWNTAQTAVAAARGEQA